MLLVGKKREELLTTECEERISYSWDDVLVEDFYKAKNHPYAVFDLKGNLLETNVQGGPGGLAMLYRENIGTIITMINEFGVDI